VAPAAFSAWAQAARGNGPVLDQRAYAGLARQSRNDRPFTYGGVEPMLFNAIATQKIAPGPGPEPRAGGEAPAAGGR
jgi:cytochrome o ubiquinol oxidase subunit 2